MLLLSVFTVALVGGMLPLINADLFTAGAAALAQPHALPWIVVAAATGQTLGKLGLYMAGRQLPARRPHLRLSATWHALLRQYGAAIVFLSGVLGLPPLFAVAFVAGGLRLPVLHFALAVLAGRALHAYGVALMPRLITGIIS